MDNKRITCITMLDNKSIKCLEERVNVANIKLCKVPYKESNREEKDKLPFHATICVWNSGNKGEILDFIKNINITNIKLEIIGTKIKKSYNNSFNLYFEFRENKYFREIQQLIYNYSKIEKYNPDIFIPHITIHIDKDYSKVIELQNFIMKDFKPFTVEFNSLGIYEVYPPIKIF